MHGSHALIEAVAAIVLTLGGAAILARAWLAARRRPRRPGVRFGGDSTHIRRRSVDVLVAVLSGAAAAIHLAVGPEHVEALGDLGLGFYWAALLQAGFAVACLVAGRTPRLAVIGIALNVGGGHDHGKGKGRELTATHAAERVTP